MSKPLSEAAGLRTEPKDGASVRRKRKLLILKLLGSIYPEAIHEETVCAKLDLPTGLTPYRIKVYIYELARGGWIVRKDNGMCKLSKPIETLYKEMFIVDPEIEA